MSDNELQKRLENMYLHVDEFWEFMYDNNLTDSDIACKALDFYFALKEILGESTWEVINKRI